jgi:hypothetical protein
MTSKKGPGFGLGVEPTACRGCPTPSAWKSNRCWHKAGFSPADITPTAGPPQRKCIEAWFTIPRRWRNLGTWYRHDEIRSHTGLHPGNHRKTVAAYRFRAINRTVSPAYSNADSHWSLFPARIYAITIATLIAFGVYTWRYLSRRNAPTTCSEGDATNSTDTSRLLRKSHVPSLSFAYPLPCLAQMLKRSLNFGSLQTEAWSELQRPRA